MQALASSAAVIVALVVGAAATLTSGTSAAADPAAAPSPPTRPASAPATAGGRSSFRLTFAGQGTVTAGDNRQKTDGTGAFDHTWVRAAPGTREFVLDVLRTKSVVDGRTVIDGHLSADTASEFKDDRRVEHRVDELPPDRARFIRAVFGLPLYRVPVGPDGALGEPVPLAPEGVRRQANLDPIVTNVRFVNPPPPPAGRDEWQVDGAVNLGQGGLARGRMTYRRRPDRAAGQMVYAATGTLAGTSERRTPDGVLSTKAVCELTGEQTYDVARGEWVAAQFRIRQQVEFRGDGTLVGTMSGTGEITLEELRPAAKQ